MSTSNNPRLRTVRAVMALASLYLVYRWIEVIRWDLHAPQALIHASTLAVFMALAWKAWGGSRWAGGLAACCPLTLLLPLDSLSRLGLALASMQAPGRILLYVVSLVIPALTLVLPAMAVRTANPPPHSDPA